MKTADMIGKTFGYLYVNERAGSQNNHALWKCTCRCGNIVIATTGDLNTGKTKSCGCWKTEQSHKRIIDEANHVYDRLTVIEQCGSNKEGKALWLCKCTCGNTIITTGKSLRSGQTRSCGCYNKERISECSLHNLTGLKFGMLTVVKRAETKYSKLGGATTMWYCKCDCGNYTTIAATALTTPNHTRSCGCIKSSFAEKEISDILNDLKVVYEREYKFIDLLSDKGYPLRFDFALLNNEKEVICLIEYQGSQHYMVFNRGFGDTQRNITDKQKKKYCKDKHIPLFEIKYNEDIPTSINEILSKINASYVNSVPS